MTSEVYKMKRSDPKTDPCGMPYFSWIRASVANSASIAHQGIATHNSPRLRYESVDHCNGLLFGFHSYLLDRLQFLLNSVARLVLNILKFSHISAAIHDELHWIPIWRRIDFKIALIMSVTAWLVLAGIPDGTVQSCFFSAVGRQHLRSASRSNLIVPRFRLQTLGYRVFAVSDPKFGTLFRSGSDNRATIYCFSNRNWKRICFSSSERFCGSISNAGPYKFPILLLLLMR